MTDELREHLCGCAECAGIFDDLKKQRELMRSLMPAAWTPDETATARAIKKARSVRIRRITGICAAAAAVVTVGVVSVMFMSTQGAKNSAADEAMMFADTFDAAASVTEAEAGEVTEESAAEEAPMAEEPAMAEESAADEPAADTGAGPVRGYAEVLYVSPETGERLFEAFNAETDLFLTTPVEAGGFSVYIDENNASEALHIFGAEGLEPDVSAGSEVLIVY